MPIKFKTKQTLLMEQKAQELEQKLSRKNIEHNDLKDAVNAVLSTEGDKQQENLRKLDSEFRKKLDPIPYTELLESDNGIYYMRLFHAIQKCGGKMYFSCSSTCRPNGAIDKDERRVSAGLVKVVKENTALRRGFLLSSPQSSTPCLLLRFLNSGHSEKFEAFTYAYCPDAVILRYAEGVNKGKYFPAGIRGAFDEDTGERSEHYSAYQWVFKPSAQFLAKQSELLPDGWYSIKLHGFALSCPCYFGETVTGRLNFVSANEEQTRRRGRFRIQRNVDGSVSIFSGKQSKYLQLSDGELMFSSPSSDFPGSKFELESLYTARDIIHIRSLESDEFIGLIKMDNTLKIRMKSESKAKTLFKFERVFMK